MSSRRIACAAIARPCVRPCHSLPRSFCIRIQASLHERGRLQRVVPPLARR